MQIIAILFLICSWVVSKDRLAIQQAVFCNSTQVYDASVDARYKKQVSDSLTHKVILNYKYKRFAWSDTCKAPRSMNYIFRINLNCQGEIVSVDVLYERFAYVNSRKKIIEIQSPPGDYFQEFRQNLLKEINNLKKLIPLEIDKKPVDCFFQYAVSYKLN